MAPFDAAMPRDGIAADADAVHHRSRSAGVVIVVVAGCVARAWDMQSLARYRIPFVLNVFARYCRVAR